MPLALAGLAAFPELDSDNVGSNFMWLLQCTVVSRTKEPAASLGTTPPPALVFQGSASSETTLINREAVSPQVGSQQCVASEVTL